MTKTQTAPRSLAATPVTPYSIIRTFTQDSGATFIHGVDKDCILILPGDLDGLRDALNEAIKVRDNVK